jgi:hypothetical protein
MNLTRALAHLDKIGVTADVLLAGDIEPHDPAAVRAEVEELLRSALAENSILVSVNSLTRLQLALEHLLTPAERARNEVLALALARDLTARGVLVAVPAATA